MLLRDAFVLQNEKVITLVGGGGKTTAMFRTAVELASLGARVIVTTTTKIFVPTPKDVGCTVIARDLQELSLKVKEKLSDYPIVCVGYSIIEEKKLRGIPPEWVAELADQADYVIVEADGANGKPFKAPAEHEPVIPGCAGIVIAIFGIETVGMVLNSENVHRSERIQAITGLRLGEPISPKAISAVLLHPSGIVKGIPPNARIAVMINKVEDETQLALARIIGRSILHYGIERVVVTQLMQDPPVKELIM